MEVRADSIQPTGFPVKQSANRPGIQEELLLMMM